MDKLEKKINEIKAKALTNHVPIVRDVTAKVLYDLVMAENPMRILEIGTAVGYSALLMKSASNTSSIVTIEKDIDRYNEAKDNIANAGVDNIICIHGDAYEVLQGYVENGEKFDFVFLDGPKGYYYRYLQLIKPMLNNGGIIFADNVGFFGMVESGIYPHRHKTIVVSLQNYLKEVSQLPFQSEIHLDVDDGYAISRYKGEVK